CATSTTPAGPTVPAASASGSSRRLQVHDGAGEGAGDAVDLLDRRHHELTELVERVARGLHDDVVGTGHVVGGHHAGDVTCCGGDLLGPSDLGLDQHVRGDAH